MRLPAKLRSPRAFSLIECLMVIAVMAIVFTCVYQIFYKVMLTNRRTSEELFTLSAVEIFQQSFIRDVRQAAQIQEVAPADGALQSLRVGDKIYSIRAATKDRRHGWRVEHYEWNHPTRVGRVSLGTRISSAQFTTQKNNEGQIILVTFLVKISPTTGGAHSEREFVLAAHPRP